VPEGDLDTPGIGQGHELVAALVLADTAHFQGATLAQRPRRPNSHSHPPARHRRVSDKTSQRDQIRGEPAARLVAVPSARHRTFGIDRGRLVVPEDFDAPLDVEVLETFEA